MYSEIRCKHEPQTALYWNLKIRNRKTGFAKRNRGHTPLFFSWLSCLLDNNSLDIEAALCNHSRVHAGVDVVEGATGDSMPFKNFALNRCAESPQPAHSSYATAQSLMLLPLVYRREAKCLSLLDRYFYLPTPRRIHLPSAGSTEKFSYVL